VLEAFRQKTVLQVVKFVLLESLVQMQTPLYAVIAIWDCSPPFLLQLLAHHVYQVLLQIQKPPQHALSARVELRLPRTFPLVLSALVDITPSLVSLVMFALLGNTR
jgi:hypothetical protein